MALVDARNQKYFVVHTEAEYDGEDKDGDARFDKPQTLCQTEQWGQPAHLKYGCDNAEGRTHPQGVKPK